MSSDTASDYNSIPRITIGLTSYNAEDTISRALKSALHQDWPNLEIVVVDDASVDATWEIISKLSTTDSRIRSVRHTVNMGAAAARNTILDQATGDIVAFFDDDDESIPDRIKTQYTRLRQYELDKGVKLIACYASGKRVYSNDYELDLPAIGSKDSAPQGEDVADYLLFNARKIGLFYGSGTPTCALMARLETFREIGGFDENLRRVEDVDFALRLALSGGHFIGCAEHLFVQYATTASDKTPYKNLESELHLVDKYSVYLFSKKRYSYARDWFKIRFYHFSGQRTRFMISLAIFLIRYPISGMKHLLRSVPARLNHERSMNKV